MDNEKLNQNNQNSEKQEFFFGDDVFYSSKNDEAINEEKPNEKAEEAAADAFLKRHSKVYHPKKSFLANVFEWLDILVASLVVVVIIFTFVFRIVAIDGDSMNNTLYNGERVIITDLFYEPKRGDIVVISRNTENSADVEAYDKPIIKRIIAVEGDTVNIDFTKGIVYVNGDALKEDYIKEPTTNPGNVKFPLVVQEDCVFVLGDNRNDSKDSRFTDIGENGQVNKKYILGHAVLRVFPLNKIGGV